MKIIITGGAGFIGSNLALALDRLHEVIVIDNFSNSNFKNLEGFKGEVYAYDIQSFDWEKFFSKKPDVIYHQAAISDTRSIDQRKIMETNANSFKEIVEYCAKNKIKLIYASSAAVYGRGNNPMLETQPMTPLNVYGFSKCIMDNLAMKYMDKMDIVGLRYFNVFGPREAHKDTFASMIYQLSNQMKKGKAPRIFKNGEQTRDHIYVKDVVLSNLKFLEYTGSGIFNVGTGVETSFNQIIKYLNKALNLNFEPEYIDNPYDFYQNRTCADISKIQLTVNFKPEFGVEEGILDYMQYLMKNKT